ncbi:MAG: hypothetical protein IJX53_01030 [Clostridia bacterium]|nr:hypothetical protein [Clostridia bacterium]
MMTRRLVSIVLLVFCIAGCTGINAFAADIIPVVPMWDNVNRAACQISFNSTAGSVSCNITADAGTDSIEGTLTLYENDVEINSWIIDVDRSYITIFDAFTGIKGRTYRLVLDVDVTCDGIIESVEVTSTKVCG